MKNKFDLSKAPNQPGVYLFKNNDVVLYVGKAKNIKKRIRQYLNGSINSYKTPILLEKSNSVEYIVCSNEKESLLLEQELIKKYKPYYNILLLDDKKYPYIAIELKSNKLDIKTKFFFKKSPKTFYYGPLPPSYGYKTIKNFLIRECLYENGIQIKSNDKKFWEQKFEYAKKILSSSNIEIIKKLKQNMIDASNNQQYELAREFRDIIQYLSNKHEEQSISFSKEQDFDVIAFKQYDDYLMINVNNFKNGSFFMNEDFIVEIKIDLYETITSFINNFYAIRNYPDFIITNYEIDSNDLLIDKKIVVPKKGNYLKAINNALKNIEINKDRKILEYESKLKTNNKVKNYFKKIINREINDLIMIDNSNESNKDIVSVIIYYKNYIPHYTNYRKYKLLGNYSRKSDVQYIREGLTSYFTNKEQIPDLIIVDGGIQQQNEAKMVLNEFSINIPIVGLVKNDKHNTEYLIDDNGKKHNLKTDNQIYNFLSKLQIEVDRFAKNYHSKIKINSSLEGFLLTIDGVGPKIEQKLLNHFGTYSNIYNASIEQLSEVIPTSLAQKIMKKLGK